MKDEMQEVVSEDSLVEVSASPAVSTPRLSDVDRMELELSKMRRKLAIAEAEKALSESNKAELEYKYIVLQLYMKYKLTAEDAIDERGNIMFGGAIQKRA